MQDTKAACKQALRHKALHRHTGTDAVFFMLVLATETDDMVARTYALGFVLIWYPTVALGFVLLKMPQALTSVSSPQAHW